MSFSNGDDNNHDFCGNDGQLCDVRDMILRCTNILPPPPQHHNSNITNFFYKWLFGLVCWSKDCRLPVVLMQASSSIWTPTMRDTRSTTSYLLVIGNVPPPAASLHPDPLLPEDLWWAHSPGCPPPTHRKEVRSVLGVKTPSWDQGKWHQHSI